MSHTPTTPGKCKATVTYYIGNWPKTKQCDKKAKKDGYCTIHNPAYIAKKEAEKDAKYQAESNAAYENHNLLSIAKTVKNELDSAGWDGQRCIESVPDMLEIIEWMQRAFMPKDKGWEESDIGKACYELLKSARGENDKA